MAIKPRRPVATLALCGLAILPFVPGAVEFARLGVPDLLLTGDAAALELGTRHAARGAQLVGPYSRFGWNHPGPAFFYLALPVYLLFDQRGPALSLFAFAANCAAAIFIVLSAQRLRGTAFAVSTAALLAVYELVAVPFLVANEWNPIFPILPLVLLYFLAARLATGEHGVLPAFVFVASVIVQTHVGYAPAVLGLCIANASPVGSALKRTLRTTIAVLAVSWMLPVYQAVMERPGNLQQLIAFFAPKNLAEHSWSAAAGTVATQMAAMPWALAQTILHRPIAPPALVVAAALAMAEVAGAAILFVRARRRGDAALNALTLGVLVQAIVGLVAVRAIRGEMLFYLVTWISAIGFFAAITVAAALATRWRAGTIVTAVVLLALACSGPVPRSAVVRQRDAAAEQLAQGVEEYLRAQSVDRPTVRISSRETWPTAVAIVLHLHKHHVPISVEREWLGVVGKPFAEPPGPHPALLVGDRAFADEAFRRSDLQLVATAGNVWVFMEPATRNTASRAGPPPVRHGA